MRKVILKKAIIGIIVAVFLSDFSISAITGLRDGLKTGTIFDLEEYTAQTNGSK